MGLLKRNAMNVWKGDLGGGFIFLIFNPKMGKIPMLTNIFQMGWNHQLVMYGH